MKKTQIALLGCGNMSSAITLGAFAKNLPFSYHAYTPTFTRAVQLAKKLNGLSYKSLTDIPPCEIYLIACKPQQFDALAINLKKIIFPNATIISIMASISTSYIAKSLNNEKIVRVMPNTPCLLNAGVSTLYFSPQVEAKSQKLIKKFFSSISEIFIFKSEKDIDITTGVSGSGPAYLFEFARIMADHLQAQNIPEDTCRKMVAQTFFGAGQMLKTSTDSFSTLRNNVTSKKGITHEALQVFQNQNLEKIVADALKAAYKKTQELAR